jgi:hypothetical protein
VHSQSDCQEEELANFHTRIAERGFGEPSIPPASSNKYYGINLAHVPLIYDQWPCYAMSINAAGIPTPPQPSHDSNLNPMPRIYTDPAYQKRRLTPYACSIQTPWAALCLADTTPLVEADIGQVRASSRDEGGFLFWPPELRRLTAVGSEIQRLNDEIIPFIQSMTRAHMFNVYSAVDEPTPGSFLKTVAAHTDPSIAASFLGRTYGTRDELLSHVATLNSRLVAARAMHDFALLEVLDACAVLGGVELPVWPPNPSYTGCWVRSAFRGATDVDETYFLQARARKLERWGVPLWYEVGRRMNRRYDAGLDGRPVSGFHALERDHQQRLGALTRRNPPIPVKVVRIAVDSRAAFRRFSPSSTPLPRDHEVRRRIERAISALVDPDSPEMKTFDAFNKDMMRLLGSGVWSGRKHEFRHHHSQIHPGSKERPRWLRIRDGVQDCGHKGVLLAAVEIPITWYDPCSYPVTFRGVQPNFAVIPRPLELPQPAVPIMDWYVVEVAGFGKEEETQARGVFDAYRSHGALGYRWMLCKVQNKDENGRSIRHSRYQIELLFKSVRVQGEAASRIASEYPHLLIVQTAYTGMDMAWINLFDLPVDWVYVAVLFNRPLLTRRRQELLSLAPPSSVPPTRSDGASPQERADAERMHLAKLCHWGLFEYDTNHPPSVQPASASAATYTPAPFFAYPSTSTSFLSASTFSPVAPPRIAQDMSQLTVERFTDLAFAPLPSDCSLSYDEALRFQRLALVLQACKRRAPFSSQVFASDGAPYRAILRYVASVVKQSSELPGYVFQSGERRQTIGPWYETLKMKADGKVEVFISTSAPLDSCSLPSQDEVDKYFEACSRENRKTRSEKRRKRSRAAIPGPSAG